MQWDFSAIMRWLKPLTDRGRVPGAVVLVAQRAALHAEFRAMVHGALEPMRP
jgi:hypothetical protein